MSVNRHPRLLTAGITFRDLVISGIDELPGLGEERYGTDFVTTWGGVANTARIGASLGARVQLLTGLGDDPNSEMCRRELTEWGIDLTPSPINPGWTLPDDEPGVWHRAGHDDGGNCVTSPTSRTES